MTETKQISLNREQQEVLTLLKEIDVICRKNGITYFLSPRLTWSAVTGKPFPSNSLNAAVFMKLQDMERFRSIAEENLPDGRALESMRNNKRFPGLFLRYENKNTLCFRLYEGRNFRYPGIGIDIIPLRAKNSSRKVRKWDQRMETGWIQICDSAKNEIDLYKFVCGCGIRLMSIAGREKLGKKIYDRLCRNQKAENAKTYFLCRSRTSIYTFPADIFREAKEAVLEGTPFLIPADDVRYLSLVYGSRYAYRNIGDTEPSMSVMVSTRVGCEDFLKEAGSLKRLVKARRRQFLMENFIDRKKEYFDWCWKYAKFCGSRKQMSFVYLDKKDYICNLWQNRDLVRLERVFRPFRRMMNQCLDENEVFEPDKEILEIYLNYLKETGNQKFLKQIEACQKAEKR